ncbi:MAG: hypothetical protein ACFFCW_30965 [Candidatus Hodarchaeota archaeon]
MPLLSREQRLLIASGGFVLFLGFSMLGLAILVAINVVGFEILMQRFYLLAGVSATVGVLDIIIGVLLIFPYKGGERVIQKKPRSMGRRSFLLGSLEVGIGFALMVASLFVYFNVLDLQTLITFPLDYIPLFILVLFLLGFVFSVNGFFLIDEGRKM